MIFPVPSKIEHFRALVISEPENELFRFSLAQAMMAEGRNADAEPHLEFCVARKKDWMMPRIVLGKMLLAKGQLIDARSLLESALRLAVAQHHETPESELRALLASMR